jgi:hypothetical protein
MIWAVAAVISGHLIRDAIIVTRTVLAVNNMQPSLSSNRLSNGIAEAAPNSSAFADNLNVYFGGTHAGTAV